jgi:uncharacterized membrane protein YhaH (DUF805 family)
MDAVSWAGLFLRSQGRIGRGRFWLGFAVLATLQAGACLVPHAGWFAFMILAYGWVCLYAKRLHDMGRSGWMTLWPILITLLALSAAAAFWLRTFDAGTDGPSLFWVSIGSLCAASLLDLLFVTWVGFAAGEADENPYGPGAVNPPLDDAD